MRITALVDLAIVFALVGCGRIDFESFDTLATQPDLWYRMNQTSGNAVIDDAVGAHDALLSGSFSWSAGALLLPDATGSAVTGALPGEFRTVPLSISLWVTPFARADQTANSYSILPFPPNAVSNDVPFKGGFGAGVNVWTDGTPGSELHIGFLPIAATPGFIAGTRYHVVVVYGVLGTLVYVDGQLVATTGIVVTDGTSSPWFIGMHNLDAMYGSKRFFVGALDDVRVYLAEISGAEITTLHVAGPS